MRTIDTWGSTAAERALAYPCDPLVDGDRRELHRAIAVDAPAAVTFRWLCQLRAAPYSYDLLDNFGRRSPRELTPGLDQLGAGQRVMRIFRLVSFERDRHLTMVLDDRAGQRVFGDLAVTYAVTSTAPERSRIVAKLVVKPPGGLAGWLAPLLPAGDLIMMRKQLRTLRSLAERSWKATGRRR